MEENLQECPGCGAKNEEEAQICSFCHHELKSPDKLTELKNKALELKDDLLARWVPQEQLDLNPSFGNLQGEYFRLPKPWFFKNPVIFTYFRVFFYTVSALIVLSFISYFFIVQRPVSMKQSSYESILSLYKQGGNPDGLIKQIDEFQEQYPETDESKSLNSLKADVFKTKLKQAMNQAENQPSLPLKIETYEFILKNYKNIDEDKITHMKSKIKEYNNTLEKNKLLLAVIEQNIEKQYFTSALNKLKPILDKGEVLGDYYTQALKLRDKAHIERIEYYLVKAQLKNAKKSLDAAKADQVDSPELKKLEAKIKKLLKI